jgi:prophage regulatory protein
LTSHETPKASARSLIAGARLYGPKGLTSLSRTTIWRGVREGWFPKPVKLSPGRNGWYTDEVEHWLGSRTRV